MQQFFLSITLICLVPLGSVASADDKIKDKTPHKIPGDNSVGHRGRWWLEIYAHTMQEEAFLRWMDTAYGSSAWRHTMQEQRVNQLWNWWCVWIWAPTHGFGRGFGNGHG